VEPEDVVALVAFPEICGGGGVGMELVELVELESVGAVDAVKSVKVGVVVGVAQVEELVANMELNERRMLEAEDEAKSEVSSTSTVDLEKLRLQRNDLKCQLTAVLQAIQSPRGDSHLR
jgi:hypothetical protein